MIRCETHNPSLKMLVIDKIIRRQVEDFLEFRGQATQFLIFGKKARSVRSGVE
jgi:hypothetical protein